MGHLEDWLYPNIWVVVILSMTFEDFPSEAQISHRRAVSNPRHPDPDYGNCICDDGWKSAGITDTLHFLQGNLESSFVSLYVAAMGTLPVAPQEAARNIAASAMMNVHLSVQTVEHVFFCLHKDDTFKMWDCFGWEGRWFIVDAWWFMLLLLRGKDSRWWTRGPKTRHQWCELHDPRQCLHFAVGYGYSVGHSCCKTSSFGFLFGFPNDVPRLELLLRLGLCLSTWHDWVWKQRHIFSQMYGLLGSKKDGSIAITGGLWNLTFESY